MTESQMLAELGTKSYGSNGFVVVWRSSNDPNRFYWGRSTSYKTREEAIASRDEENTAGRVALVECANRSYNCGLPTTFGNHKLPNSITAFCR